MFNPDHNPILRYALNKSLYEQFCAGQDADEVAETVARVKDIGFTGAILGYARETPTEMPQNRIQPTPEDKADKDISDWLENSLETARLARAGDFVALKFTGAGSLAHEQLRNGSLPGPYLTESINRICQFARDRGVRVLIDGEHDELQTTIDKWTLDLAARYNTIAGKAIVFGTYQSYKKTMPEVLVSHLEEARSRGFTLGVKLVRANLTQTPATTPPPPVS
ncbi:hypothetical protein NLG97_g9499 [Lecanicillium saksenae]|uniref:Uncharacterized protein n=1 Tax=Lecanicillium saksenae TaxID=468837 RepID=A0ACC1QHP7_9HYPO|nr:hypothetical protein NLG97_g9499 [Lecanicillium saksenae]